MAPYSTGRLYANYLTEGGDDRVRAAYGAERHARLVAIKDRYDAQNLFHLNQNIRPSGATSVNGAGIQNEGQQTHRRPGHGARRGPGPFPAPAG